MKPLTKRIICWTIGIVLLAAIVCLGMYFKSVADYKQAVSAITIEDIDIAAIPDGTYIGECDVDFVYAKVQVSVKAGAITDIAILEHKNGQGKPAEVVVDNIVAQQDIGVDTIAGATNSSIVLKKAVANALA